MSAVTRQYIVLLGAVEDTVVLYSEVGTVEATGKDTARRAAVREIPSLKTLADAGETLLVKTIVSSAWGEDKPKRYVNRLMEEDVDLAAAA